MVLIHVISRRYHFCSSFKKSKPISLCIFLVLYPSLSHTFSLFFTVFLLFYLKLVSTRARMAAASAYALHTRDAFIISFILVTPLDVSPWYHPFFPQPISVTRSLFTHVSRVRHLWKPNPRFVNYIIISWTTLEHILCFKIISYFFYLQKYKNCRSLELCKTFAWIKRDE